MLRVFKCSLKNKTNQNSTFLTKLFVFVKLPEIASYSARGNELTADSTVKDFNLDYKHYQHLFIFLNNSWKTLLNSILFALIKVSIPLSENFPVNVNYWLMEN